MVIDSPTYRPVNLESGRSSFTLSKREKELRDPPITDPTLSKTRLPPIMSISSSESFPSPTICVAIKPAAPDVGVYASSSYCTILVHPHPAPSVICSLKNHIVV